MTVFYDVQHHKSVIFSLHGTVWPKVLPFCFLNMAITYAVFLLRDRGTDLTFDNHGHTTLAMMISFLVVARCNISYYRFWEARTRLSNLISAIRKVAFLVVIMTQSENSEKALIWRESAKRRLLRLFRTTMRVVQDERVTIRIMEGKLKEDDPDILNQDLLTVPGDYVDPIDLAASFHGLILASGNYLDKPITDGHLMDYMGEFVNAYHELLKYTSTPYPFPVVQMARTILFLWVFTLPFALANDMGMGEVIPCMSFMFFITYGFVGLEFVSIELHDPFGNDPNDFEITKFMNTTASAIERSFNTDHSSVFDAESDKNIPIDCGRLNIPKHGTKGQKSITMAALEQRYSSDRDKMKKNSELVQLYHTPVVSEGTPLVTPTYGMNGANAV